ncbi:MAG: transcriptional regulator [Rhodoglobus sp.]|nr:transcriptional regulator [Rhodoglobus sp.]
MDDIRGSLRCPIARTLDVLGDRWTLLIVRDAIAGSTRFTEFRESLGMPRDVLADRLDTLVAGGVLERRTVSREGQRARDEYFVTDVGRELMVVLGALGDWGARNRPWDEPPLVTFTDAAGTPVAPRFVSGSREVPLDEVLVAAG